MVKERLRSLRERLQRREKSKRAERRASARRVEIGEPESTTEAVKVKGRKAKEETEETIEEARGLGKDASELVATELGISRDEARKAMESTSGFLEGVGDADLSDSGDGDLLSEMEKPMGMGEGDDASLDLGTDAQEPLFDPTEEDDLL